MSWTTLLFWIFGGSLGFVVVWGYLTHRLIEEAADRVQAVLAWEPQTLDELMEAVEGDGSSWEAMPLAHFHAAMEVLVDEGWAQVHEPVRKADSYAWSRIRGGKRRKRHVGWRLNRGPRPQQEALAP